MLVHAHTDALRIDLNQLGQWILDAPRNRNRTAQADIQPRQFGFGEWAGAVNTGPSLVHHQVVQAFALITLLN